jgi:hypothetical protein
MRRRLILSIALLFVFAAGSVGEGRGSTLVLKLSWAKKFRDLLSIDAKATITALNASKGEDGDTHGGSRRNGVGLPMVAEILNGHAAAQKEARDALKPGTQPEKDVYGAWRLWFEHPPHNGVQCQSFGKTVPAICSNQSLGGAESNPEHSFEIHPVFAVNGISVGRSSLKLTPDNQSVKKTEVAMAHYTGQNKVLTVVRSNTALTMTSITVSHNYARLRIRVTKAKTDTKRARDGTVDGGFVIADVLASEDEAQVLRAGLRMFYLRDSGPGDALDPAVPGNEFIILGMPRINLDAVLKATETQSTVTMPLPFEFVVVALIQVL